MDALIRGIESLIKAAKAQDARMINLIVAGANIGNQAGYISDQDIKIIWDLASRLLEEM